MLSSFPRFVRTQVRFLTFRSTPIDQADHRPFLGWALAFTWLAGLGRYWDHQSAEVWQYAGLGSVVYVFVLALVLWGVGHPLRPRAWRYQDVLLFVSMTSPPAILYAIPVERFTDFESASSLNVWFLGVVATWRVLLLLRHLSFTGGLGLGLGITVSLLPLAGIVTALTLLNLEHSTFELMAMPDPAAGTTNDKAYDIVVALSMLSILAFLPLLLAYSIAVGIRNKAPVAVKEQESKHP